MTLYPQTCSISILLVAFVAHATAIAEDAPKIDPRFRNLIPAAADIDRETFEKIARSPQPLDSILNENSLTAELMQATVPDTPEASPVGGKSYFRYLANPKPQDIAQEMYRRVGIGRLATVARPVTMIHAERITRCEAEVSDDQATGSFDFRVPKLYEGRCDFTARKKGSEWQITSFKIAAPKIHVMLNEDGKWVRGIDDAERN